MATQYFGSQTDKSTPSPSGYGATQNTSIYKASMGGFQCPGSGSFPLTELSAWVKYSGSGSGVMRIAIYTNDSSPTLIAQGSSAIAVTSTDPAWLSHTSFIDADASPVTPNLTGGTYYRMAYSCSNTSSAPIGYISGTAGDMVVTAVDYSDGDYPSSLSLTAWSSSSAKRLIIVGIEVSSEISIPVLQSTYRRRRF